MSNAERVFAYPFADIYRNYIAKVTRKGKTPQDLDDVLQWLTGYDSKGLHKAANSGQSLREFFTAAPKINVHAELITGVVCGVRVEEIEDPLMKRIRWMDKLVDELARGKKVESIKRRPK